MRRLAAAALIAVLTLTACAVPTDPGWTPPSWPAPHVTVVDPPEPVDAASLPGVVGQRLRNDDVRVQSRWMRLPGAPAVEEGVLPSVRTAIERQETATGTGYAPQVFDVDAGLGERACVTGSTRAPAADVLADPALGPPGGTGTAVVCDIVVAVGTMIGQRVRTVTGVDGRASSDTSVLHYVDTADGRSVDAAGLWRDDAADRLWEDIVDAIRREAGALSLAPVAPPEGDAAELIAAALATTVPAEDGSLVVTVPAGFTAPELEALGIAATTGPSPVAVAPPRSAELVSDFGADLVAAVVGGAPFTPPVGPPAGAREVDCTLFPCVSLTYDDGPSEWTSVILDAAREYDAGLTFFALGQKAAGWADTLARAVSEGHLVENHTWNHPDLTTLEPDRVRAEIDDTSAALQAASGEPVRAFRPPYGAWDREVLQIAGLPAILWDVDTEDWKQPGDDELVRRAVDRPRPGSIVLQHDIHANTGRTVERVMSGLRDRGFVLVTVAQLFGGSFPTRGAWQSGR
ncbi:polysaccharide deacetylase family protein [Microbacterium aquimaris]|uniref:Polysaccharide deacetylase family protein n=1 Tax=Microbacterium aquimaris TaxID=459816 RepID=A0ABU5N5R1_9MICO|nr:polysaccharide deacetylase family protein [Microbacterium aquimaris]MDZ8161418.1 polysaccharide deacetylase family protein [Microbacterium aquimaris]